MSLLFKCAADRKTETLSIGNNDQDDLILSRIMTAPHLYTIIYILDYRNIPYNILL